MTEAKRVPIQKELLLKARDLLTKEDRDNIVRTQVTKGFLSGVPDGGMHAHTLDRAEKRTLKDGAHFHIFLRLDGVPMFTEEDGAHWHTVPFGSDRSGSEVSSHQHDLVLEDESLLTTQEDGWHGHENMIETTGFDGLHWHMLEVNGEMLFSLTPGEIAILMGTDADTEIPIPMRSATRMASNLLVKAKDFFSRKDTHINEIDEQDRAIEAAALGYEVEDEPLVLEKAVLHIDLGVPIPEGYKEQKLVNCPILKQDQEKQIVYSIVLEPDVEDTQGDMVSAEDIEQAAHFYLKEARVVGRAHRTKALKAAPVESYIAPVDFEMESPSGLQKIKKGTWVLGIHIPDSGDWAKVKDGTYEAFSMGGFGLRIQD